MQKFKEGDKVVVKNNGMHGKITKVFHCRDIKNEYWKKAKRCVYRVQFLAFPKNMGTQSFFSYQLRKK